MVFKIKIFLRSILFNIAFYGGTFCFSIIFSPVLLFPRKYTVKVAKLWIRCVIYICRTTVGLDYKIIGQDNIPNTPCLFAVKHQSAWETLIFYELLKDPSVVLKNQLLWIPLFGFYLKKLGTVPLQRSKGRAVQDLKKLLKNSKEAIDRGQSVIIFPEGTRSHPSQKGIYHSGIASMYLHLGLPVIPVAHNSGLFWPRRGFLKYPGQITLEILEPIKPGLSRHEFMRILEDKIETKTRQLVNRGK